VQGTIEKEKSVQSSNGSCSKRVSHFCGFSSMNTNKINRLEQRFYSSTVESTEEEIKDIEIVRKEIVNLSSINHLVEKEKIIQKKNNKFKNTYSGGFKSYNIVILLNEFIFTFQPNIETISVDRDTLSLSVRKFLSELEDNLTYSVLFSAKSTNGENIHYTISKSSMILHKDYPESALTDLILNDINRYLNTYLSHRCDSTVSFNLIAQFKIWVSEEEYGKEKFMSIKRYIVEDGKKRLKILTNLNSIKSEDDIILKGLQKMKFYDFNLSFNHWFEKELFFNSLDGSNKGLNNNLDLNIKDIIKLYHDFLILLQNNKDVVYYLDNKYNDNGNDMDENKLKIMFRKIVRGGKPEMVNN
jgi:hypothetical protein